MSQWFGKIWHSKKRSQFQCMSQTKPNWPLWTTLPIVNITAGRRSRNIRKVMPNLHILSVGNPLDPFLYCGNFCGRRLRAKTEIIVQRLWEKRTKRQIIVWRFWEKCTKRQIIVCWGGIQTVGLSQIWKSLARFYTKSTIIIIVYIVHIQLSFGRWRRLCKIFGEKAKIQLKLNAAKLN